MNVAWSIGTALAGYVLGSLPFGYLVARAHGVDIFKVGSGNPGATNVKRALGPKAGNTVLALDMVKGAAATAWPLVPAVGAPQPEVMALVGIVAAVVGHSFSVFTRFRGGKGVATAGGGLLVLMPLGCLLACVAWLAGFGLTRYVSLGSLAAAATIIATSWLLGYHPAIATVATVLATFVIVRHQGNIRRLCQGTENRFARPPKDAAPGA